MTNIYGYVRVSTKDQNLDLQIEKIKDYCKLKNYDILNIFSDKLSGKNADRPGYTDLLKAIEKNPMNAELVICTKLDRMSRSIRDLINFVDFLEKKEIGMVVIDSNLDTKSREGKLFFYIMASLAEFERELIAERTKSGRDRYIANGGKLGKPYKKIPLDEIRRLVNEGVPKSKVARMFKLSRPTLNKRLYGKKE